MAKKEDIWYVVPEIEVRVHESWVRLIQYCQENLPYGELKIQLSNAMPTKRVKETPSIRFDKQKSKTKGKSYVISSIDVHIHEYWINLIQWCQNYLQKGEIEFKIVNACPTDLISAKQEVRFDKQETIPSGLPLEFSKTA